MELGLKGKVALVTGSTGGIGFATAKILRQEGAHVYVNGRTKDRVKEAIDKMKLEGVTGELRPAPFDLTKKAGVEALLKELTAGTGVTVNSVLPGPTYSPGVEQFMADIAKSRGITAKEAEEQFFKTVRPGSLIKRFATSDEVGALIAFVCSTRAAAINGAALRVDGGVVHSIL